MLQAPTRAEGFAEGARTFRGKFADALFLTRRTSFLRQYPRKQNLRNVRRRTRKQAMKIMYCEKPAEVPYISPVEVSCLRRVSLGRCLRNSFDFAEPLLPKYHTHTDTLVWLKNQELGVPRLWSFPCPTPNLGNSHFLELDWPSWRVNWKTSF